ncbi:MAG: T9SS type A sorting domain-containing protein [candidate division Zixibacteria bacterium]|nr:T9SS type A sorting domain-containing protein [candidate division Zixibacteria bacterium]
MRLILLFLLLTNIGYAETYFVNVADSIGLGGRLNVRGIAVFDANNDGWDDLFLACNSPRNYLFINQGGEYFIDQTTEYGVYSTELKSSTVSVADLNNDDFLDLLVVQNDGDTIPMLYMNQNGEFFNDIAEEAGLIFEFGGCAGNFISNRGKSVIDIWASSSYFAHNGDITFIEITERVGLGGQSDLLAADFVDIDNDMDMDLLLSYRHNQYGNFFRYEDSFYVNINENNNLGYIPSSYGSSFGDYDNDGDPDLYILNGLGENTLFENDGSGYLIDRTEESGTGAREYCRNANWGDIDNDGDLDLIVGVNEERRPFVYTYEGSHVFLDRSHQFGIVDITEGWGAALGDYDNDGDLDIFMPGLDEFANIVYRNETNNNDYIKFKVVGPTVNRAAIGAKVFLYECGHLYDPEYLLGSRYVQSLTGPQSMSSQIVHFGVPGEGPFDALALFINGDPAVISGAHKTNSYDLVSGEVTSINDGFDDLIPIENDIAVRCYPVPTNSMLNLEISLSNIDDIDVVIFDLSGRKVKSIPIGIIDRHLIRTIDVSKLPSGIYFAAACGSNNKAVTKLVILK